MIPTHCIMGWRLVAVFLFLLAFNVGLCEGPFLSCLGGSLGHLAMGVGMKGTPKPFIFPGSNLSHLTHRHGKCAVRYEQHFPWMCQPRRPERLADTREDTNTTDLLELGLFYTGIPCDKTHQHFSFVYYIISTFNATNNIDSVWNGTAMHSELEDILHLLNVHNLSIFLHYFSNDLIWPMLHLYHLCWFLISSFLKHSLLTVFVFKVIHRYYSQNNTLQQRVPDSISVDIRISKHSSFVFKWCWNIRKTLCHISAMSIDCLDLVGDQKKDSIESKCFLDELIFRPWLLKRPSHNSENRSGASAEGSIEGNAKQTTEGSSSENVEANTEKNVSPGTCQQSTLPSPVPYQQVLVVSPVTQFLPNATCNPDIDLAFVGYRLATLSKLPESVPVSRVQLAESGFYFEGPGDEVTCYSCRLTRSGWSRGDNPADVHRRLSPSCQHLLLKETELLPPRLQSEGSDAPSTPALPNSSGLSSPSMLKQLRSQSAGNGSAHGVHLLLNNGHNDSGVGPSGHTHIENGIAASNIQQLPSNGHSVNGISRNLKHKHCNGHTPVENGKGANSQQVLSNGHTHTPRTNETGSQRPQFLNSSTFNSSTASETAARQRAGTDETDAIAGIQITDDSGTSQPGSYGAVTNGFTQATHQLSSANGAAATSSNVSAGMPSGPSGNVRGLSAVPPEILDDGDDSGNFSGEGSLEEPRRMFPQASLCLGGAVYPMFQHNESRKRTFTSWDESRAPSLDTITMCGMFYAGYADCVRCFYCGIGMRDWTRNLDIWQEHVKLSPSCGFLRAVKGDAYIKKVQNRHKPENQKQQGFEGATFIVKPGLSAKVVNGASGVVIAAASRGPSPTNAATAAVTRGSNGLTGGRISVTETPSVNGERNLHLQAEDGALLQRFQCKGCRRNTAVSVILMPCGHLSLCPDCVASASTCPQCHTPITSFARVTYD